MKTTIFNKVKVFGKWVLPFYLFTFLPFVTSCNKWLDIEPNNEQVTNSYWKSKEDVESVISAGYSYLRQCVPTLIKWGELRGGAIYTTNSNDQKLQDFNILPSNSLCKWDTFYKVIGMANSVIMYVPGVQDDTYYASIRNSHLAEAYFLRAYCYLILVKNYKEVPLVLEAYVNDHASFDKAKSSEEDIIEQIKSDVKTALETGAAKGTYEEEWATKGRVTKWALYALMADACLWSEDYDQCIEYCDMILNATDTFRPAFMSNTSDWYTMFYPGNSNESVFELNWDYSLNGVNNNFSNLFTITSGSPLQPTEAAVTLMREETQALKEKGTLEDGRMGRMLLCTYVPETATALWPTSQRYYIWKYYGTDVPDISGGVRAHQDANFIIYRVAEIMLIKAQALVMKGVSNWPEAITLINRIRHRAGLENYKGDDVSISDVVAQSDELSLLEEILKQKELEMMAEAKRWYDLLWFGRIGNSKYKGEFISLVLEGNSGSTATTNSQWIESVLQDPNAWYMPIPEADIEHNKALEQNPYYSK